MSWNLTQENQLDLFSRNFNTKALITESLDATQLNATEVISNKLQTTTGNNYLGLWSATKLYKTGDLVVFNNLLYRCLVNDTILTAPDPNDPAQPEWVQLTSNNAIKSDPLYIQVSQVNGDDAKALIAPVPFKTLQAAINFAANGATINLIDRNSVWNELITIDNKQDLTIDGGLNGTQMIGVGNRIVGSTANSILITINDNCGGITFKNVIFQRTLTTVVCFDISVGTSVSKNYNLDNCIFEQPNITTTGMNIRLNGINFDFGDINIVNCRNVVSSFPNNNFFSIGVTQTIATTGLQAISRINIENYKGVVLFSPIPFTITPTNANFFYINAFNSDSVALQNTQTVLGNIFFKNCILTSFNLNSFGNIATNAQANNKLTLINCSLYNREANAYILLNKTGNAPYQFIDLDYDRNLVGTTVNGTGNIFTSGPARWFNMLAQLSSAAGTTALITNTATQLPFGAISVETPIDFVNVVNPNELTLSLVGVYRVILLLESNTSATAAQCQSVSVWLGPVGSTEATSTYLQSYVSPFVSNIVTFPTSRFSMEFYTNQNVSSIYSFYARNTSATTFNVRVISVYIQSIR